MGATFWAKWSCGEPVRDLRNLILPLVLAEGYDLLSWQGDRQVFDRGDTERRLAWSLSGSAERWADSPTMLTISYDQSPLATAVTFCWTLSVKPLPATDGQKASFEAWLRGQMERIVSGLRRQLEAAYALEMTTSPAVEPLQPGTIRVTDDGVGVTQLTGTNAATALRSRKVSVEYATAAYETTPLCDQCSQPAMPVPGAAGRYYCLGCRRHLSRPPVA